jgi:hypothetical protein
LDGHEGILFIVNDETLNIMKDWLRSCSIEFIFEVHITKHCIIHEEQLPLP